MMLVCYRTDGMKYVVRTPCNEKELAELIARRVARDPGLEADWDGPGCCELSHDSDAYTSTYKLRPDDWPLINGEPT